MAQRCSGETSGLQSRCRRRVLRRLYKTTSVSVAGFLGYFTATRLRSRARAWSESVGKLWCEPRGDITSRFYAATRLEILNVPFYDEASLSLSSRMDADVENVPARIGDIKDAEPRWCAIVLISDLTRGTFPDNVLLRMCVRRIVLMQLARYLQNRDAFYVYAKWLRIYIFVCVCGLIIYFNCILFSLAILFK